MNAFQISLSLRELQVIRDLLCVTDITEKSLNILLLLLFLKSSYHRCSVEKSVLKKFESLSEKHLCSSLFLIKFIKKRLQHKCCLEKSAKFLRTPILKNICERLLLHLHVLSFTIHENDIAN